MTLKEMIKQMNTNPLLLGLLFCSCWTAATLHSAPSSQMPNDRTNYPSNFQVDKGWDLCVFGEYLYWTANENGLYFAQTGSDLGADIAFDGKIKRIQPQWESGGRAGLGLNFPKSGYDLLFLGTWFATHGHQSARASDRPLIPLWARPENAPFTATQAFGKWNLDVKVLDLEWGKSSWFGGKLSLRPFFGIRGARLIQTLKVRYDYAIAPDLTDHLRSHSNFEGVGLRAGCDIRFALPYNFAVYGLSSGSILCGKMRAGMRTYEGDLLIARTKDHFWKTLPSFQLGLGIAWDDHFSNDRLHLEFHIGWEQNIWFTVNQMNHYMNRLNSGYYFKENSNLATQGLVAGGRFDF